VRLWSVDSGDEVCVMTAADSGVRDDQHDVTCVSSAFHDGSGRQLVASGSADRMVRLWDVTTGKLEHVMRGHESFVVCVGRGFEDSRGVVLLASASRDGTVRLWNTDSGEQDGDSLSVIGLSLARTSLYGTPTCMSECVTASTRDGVRRLIVVGYDDGAIVVWDVSRRCAVSILGDGTSRPVVWSINGVVGDAGHAVIATSSLRGIRLWHVDELVGECEPTVRVISRAAGLDGTIRSLSRCFKDSNGRSCIASLSSDSMLRVWNVSSPSGEPVAAVRVDEEMGIDSQLPPSRSSTVATVTGSSDATRLVVAVRWGILVL
jgi:WD40 repeat protein